MVYDQLPLQSTTLNLPLPVKVPFFFISHLSSLISLIYHHSSLISHLSYLSYLSSLSSLSSLTSFISLISHISHLSHISSQVLGFWMWWLFIIPSLRARKPSAQEKEALNWAFLLSPLVSIALPSATKDTVVIWWANAAATAACYVFAYNKPVEDEKEGEGEGERETAGEGEVFGKPMEQPNFFPRFVLQAFRALDYGSGQERGTRR